MRVDSLHIRKAPGLPDGLPELKPCSGLTVIVGPNASGKSTVARVLRELLWPDAESSGAEVRSRWQVADGEHTASVFAGQVHWQPPLSAQVPPGAAGLARFGMASLLSADDADDQKLGERVARELAGGLDLVGAEERFSRPARLHKNTHLAQSRKKAAGDLRSATGRTRLLADKENQLSGLKAQIATTQDAAQRKAAAERLLELIEAAETVSTLEKQTFSEGLGRLVGDECEWAQALANALSKHEAALSERKAELKTLAKAVDANTFPGEPPRRSDLDTWATRLTELAQIDSKVSALRIAVASAEQRVHDCRGAIATDEGASELTSAILGELAQGIARGRDTRAVLKTQQTAVATWEAWARGADEDPAPLREVISNLRAWLRASGGSPPPGEASPSNRLAWALVITGLVALAIAAATATPWLSAALFVSGVGAAMVWRAGRQKPAHVDGDPRAVIQQAVERSQHKPSAWDVDAIEEHLTALQARLGTIEQALRATDQLDGARRSLGEAQELHEGQLTALDQLAARVGVSADFVELGAVEQVHGLIEWLDARAELARCATELAATEASLSDGLDDCAAWLAKQGCEQPADVAAATASLTQLVHQCADLHEAQEQTRQAEGRRDRMAALLDEGKKESDALWDRATVPHGDLAALAQRMQEHKAWVKHEEALRAAQANVLPCRGRFEKAAELPQLGETAPESVTQEQASEWIATLASEAAQVGELNEKAGGLTSELRLASEGHDLEDALAAKLQAEQALAVEREQAVLDALARELLAQAREQHETTHAPPTLQRAQDRFALFTHNGWRLELGADGAFCAHDVGAAETRSLAELSDGTRVQLLLAVRLAALEEQENPGEPMPVCLDEALSIADPERFHEIAAALLQLADDGRQILYFTADPAEAAQWDRVCTKLGRASPLVLDLAALDGDTVDWGGELPPLPAEPESVPDPAGQTAEEYAKLLNVTPPDGFRDAATWHLYFIAHRHLDALAACLRHRLTTIGHWREAVRRGSIPTEIPDDVARSLSAHGELAQALAESWRIGRGRPVTWDDVETSDAISASYAGRVRTLLAEHGRDPRQFAEAVRQLDRFREKQADKLSAHLEQIGCLPQEQPLSPEDLTPRALQNAPDATQKLGAEQSASFVSWLVSVLRG